MPTHTPSNDVATGYANIVINNSMPSHTHTITHSGCFGGVQDSIFQIREQLPPVITVAGAIFLALASYAAEKSDGLLISQMDDEDDETGLRCEAMLCSRGKEVRLDLDHLFYLAFTDVEAAYRYIDVTLAMLPGKLQEERPAHTHYQYGVGWTSPNGIFGSSGY